MQRQNKQGQKRTFTLKLKAKHTDKTGFKLFGKLSRSRQMIAQMVERFDLTKVSAFDIFYTCLMAS